MQHTANQEFAINASPDAWAGYACEIRDAMNLLWNRSDGTMILNYSSTDEGSKKTAISRTWLLLAGFALENLLKGLAIAEDPDLISNGQLHEELKTHKLTKLVDLIGSTDFDENEMDLLATLESCIPTWGRYPIPLKASDIAKEVPATTDEKRVFDQLFERLDLHLYKMIRTGWQGPHETWIDGLLRTEHEDMPDGWREMSFAAAMRWRDSQLQDD